MKNDFEKKAQVRRTRNRLANSLQTLEENKRMYIEKAKTARARGDKHAYSLARSGLAATVVQSKRTREMLLNIDITAQMRDTGAITEEFLTGMETIFKRLSKVNKSINMKQARAGLRTAITGMESVQAQLDCMLEESEDAFAALSSAGDNVSEQEIDRLLGQQAALDEEDEVGAELDKLLGGEQTAERVAVSAAAGEATPYVADASAREQAAPVQAGGNGQAGGVGKRMCYPRGTALPPLDLLNDYRSEEDVRRENEQALVENAAAAEKALAELGVPAKVVRSVCGPTYGRLEMVMPTGMSVQKIDPLVADIAMRLGKPARFEVPIAGKNAFGIEVQNDRREIVGLKELLASDAFRAAEGDLLYCLGIDAERTPIVKDLARAPHLLVAGCTGSGKSCFLHTLLTSLFYRYTPAALRVALIDLKRVEMAVYNGSPYLITDGAVDTDEDALTLFNELCDEMERRYALLLGKGCRNIKEYNRSAAESEKLPYIVAVIDEYSDISTSPMNKEFDASLRRLSQKARASGIHLVLATQRPSVDVISGTIKSNFPTQVAFRTVRKEDSRTILSGQSGAEQLIGNGDLLFAEASEAGLKRVQAPFITGAELQKVCAWLKTEGRA
ncbi:MAG: hypothetical protein K2L51_02370 [Clostridiales bacterium]|nr:hypothetical protein [Clostridiales bacterium]